MARGKEKRLREITQPLSKSVAPQISRSGSPGVWIPALLGARINTPSGHTGQVER